MKAKKNEISQLFLFFNWISNDDYDDKYIYGYSKYRQILSNLESK